MHSTDHRLHDDNQSLEAEKLRDIDYGTHRRKPWVDPSAARISPKKKRDTFEER